MLSSPGIATQHQNCVYMSASFSTNFYMPSEIMISMVYNVSSTSQVVQANNIFYDNSIVVKTGMSLHPSFYLNKMHREFLLGANIPWCFFNLQDNDTPV